MSAEGLFRLHLGGLFWTSVLCLLIWVVLGLVARTARSEGEPDAATGLLKLRRLLLAVTLVLSGIWLVDGLVTNATPRSVIDRDGVNQQQEEHERRIREEARKREESQKKEESR